MILTAHSFDRFLQIQITKYILESDEFMISHNLSFQTNDTDKATNIV